MLVVVAVNLHLGTTDMIVFLWTSRPTKTDDMHIHGSGVVCLFAFLIFAVLALFFEPEPFLSSNFLDRGT